MLCSRRLFSRTVELNCRHYSARSSVAGRFRLGVTIHSSNDKNALFHVGVSDLPSESSVGIALARNADTTVRAKRATRERRHDAIFRFTGSRGIPNPRQNVYRHFVDMGTCGHPIIISRRSLSNLGPKRFRPCCRGRSRRGLRRSFGRNS